METKNNDEPANNCPTHNNETYDENSDIEIEDENSEIPDRTADWIQQLRETEIREDPDDTNINFMNDSSTNWVTKLQETRIRVHETRLETKVFITSMMTELDRMFEIVGNILERVETIAVTQQRQLEKEKQNRTSDGTLHRTVVSRLVDKLQTQDNMIESLSIRLGVLQVD